MVQTVALLGGVIVVFFVAYFAVVYIITTRHTIASIQLAAQLSSSPLADNVRVDWKVEPGLPRDDDNIVFVAAPYIMVPSNAKRCPFHSSDFSIALYAPSFDQSSTAESDVVLAPTDLDGDEYVAELACRATFEWILAPKRSGQLAAMADVTYRRNSVVRAHIVKHVSLHVEHGFGVTEGLGVLGGVAAIIPALVGVFKRRNEDEKDDSAKRNG